MSENRIKDNLVLFVDDEEKTRKYFARLFGLTFNIIVAKDGVEALALFKDNIDDIGLVVTDQKMPNMTGSELLKKVAELKPLCVRVLSTAYADIDAAVDSVNNGGIYRYVTKPWEVSDLEVTLMRAMEHYMLQKERDAMLRQKLSSVEMLASSDRVLSIASMAVFGNEELRRVGEALQTLVQLAEVGAEDSESHQLIDESLNWRELYRRQPGLHGLSEAERVRRIADSCGMNEDRVARALTGESPTDPQQFTRVVRDLQTLSSKHD